MKKPKTSNIIFLFLVLVAFVLRFYKITQNPPSLNWDEVSHGYNAYSILKTGKDEWGKILPLIFRAYGDYKLPLYIYLTVISEFFFGLNAFSVRLVSALAGVGVVIMTYFLVYELFANNRKKFFAGNTFNLAILSSFLVAIEPWSLFLSRAAFEANLAIFLIIAAALFFLKGVFKSARYLILSSLLFGLSTWAYNSARIFVPIFLVSLFFIFKKEIFAVYRKDKKNINYSLILLALFFVPMFYQLANPVGQARYGKVAIIDHGAIAKIIELRENSEFATSITRLIYNRPIFFLQKFTSNWLSHFSLDFLFFKGGDNYQFSIPEHGLVYLINLPFFLIGLTLLLISAFKGDKTSFLILSWFLLAPIPSSLTREAPHVLRSIVILPIPMILVSSGVNFFLAYFKGFFKYLFIFLYTFFLIFFLLRYLGLYFGSYRIDYSHSWQYGYKQMVDYLLSQYPKYEKIIITKKYGEPHEFLLFYSGWNPQAYREDINLKRFYQSGWYWVDTFDKFYFVNDWDIPRQEWQDFVLESKEVISCRGKRCLLVTSPGNVPKGWSKLKTIHFLDGKVAFEIYQN